MIEYCARLPPRKTKTTKEPGNRGSGSAFLEQSLLYGMGKNVAFSNASLVGLYDP